VNSASASTLSLLGGLAQNNSLIQSLDSSSSLD
jgi:hypothetical protein